ncbi:DUF2787 family protein [Vibrio sp. ER1A]|uniref:DUF2787 family protein n=1 Tax=Vibrio sp. ER1A TaxID=1517681 RepID=UPI0004DD0370|nr:DUF2787 family protein [Vibrio sp. ER1A]KFA94923.1 hypothetical protein HW45_28725 [Vibrio sp. ER1A]
MTTTIIASYDYGVCLPKPLLESIEMILAHSSIPADVTMLSINFRSTAYYQTRSGPHPVEIRLERQGVTWCVVFIASFAYPDETHRSVTPELYFNVKRGWFYQPDITACELDRPEVRDLLLSWSRMFCRQLLNEQFDDIRLTEVKG